MPSQDATDVLVVGAGPTGLVLALWLKRLGVRVRIIDKATDAGTTSRALVVHARTLELYRQMGIADDVVDRGLRFSAINMWVGGEHAARAELADLGRGMTPYPYVIIYPQDQHERLLIEHLRRAGVEVERGVSLAAFEEREGDVVATIASGGRESRCTARFVVGCDGARSTVREGLGVGFPGGTYERVFYVADVALHGPPANHELHVALDEADLLAVFPMKGDNVARLIGTVRRDAEAGHEKLQWSDVAHDVVTRMRIRVDDVRWFSTYRVHHRVADRFRRGRVFLAGDAAHIHSPVGGQGMNTGIGDAVNLAWKLAAVLGGRARESILDTYEPERSAFARRLVATTDRAFTFVTRDGAIARRVRMEAVPAILPRLLRSERVRRFMFHTISQTRIRYRHSALSEGHAGRVHGGDRLPWAEGNFAPLASIAWQAHVYGEAAPALRAACEEARLPLHVMPFTAEAERAGLARNALYLVRPDGYVALADADARPDALTRYMSTRGIRLT